ncbi:extracellular calcium-sensing receptor-like [Leptodactylus fuscus]
MAETTDDCSGAGDSLNMRYLRHYLAFDFAIEEINRNPSFLPNITLGYDIYDTCDLIGQAAQATMRALSGGVKHYWNYRCGDNGKTVAFIGHLLYGSSQAISQMLSPYGHPQISYGERFYSKMNYPFYYHTAHDPNVVNKAVVALLKYFGWTWIGIITDDEHELIKASEDLMGESLKSGICVEYIHRLLSRHNIDFIKKSEAKVVVLYVSFNSYDSIITALSHFSKIVIYTKDLLSNICTTEEKYLVHSKESLFFVSQKGNIIGLKEVLQKASPIVYPKNKILHDIWLYKFGCVLSDSKSNTNYLCSKNYTLTYFPSLQYDVDTFRTTYSVYLAVYAVAHSLNNMYMAESKSGKRHGSFIQRIHPKKLNIFLRNVHFTTLSGDNIIFNEMGLSSTHLELLRTVIFPNKTFTKLTVGEYNPNANGNNTFFIGKDYKTSLYMYRELSPWIQNVCKP